MKRALKFVFFSSVLYFPSLIIFPGFAFGKDTASAVSPLAFRLPKWQVGVSSLHYGFRGSRPANNDIYSFDDVTYQLQNLDVTYFHSPTLHFSLSANYARNYAETNFLGTLFKDSTRGFTDTVLKTKKLFIKPSGIYVFDIGLSLPTGSIDEKNQSAPIFNYPYNMQLGSGTYDFLSNFTYIKTLKEHQFGGLASLRNHFGNNNQGYRRGDTYVAKLWYSYKINKYISPGLWMNYQFLDSFSGEDRTFGRNIFVEFYHHSRQFWDFSLYVNSEVMLNKTIKLKGLAGLPIWQGTDNIDNIELFYTFFAQVGLEAKF